MTTPYHCTTADGEPIVVTEGVVVVAAAEQSGGSQDDKTTKSKQQSQQEEQDNVEEKKGKSSLLGFFRSAQPSVNDNGGEDAAGGGGGTSGGNIGQTRFEATKPATSVVSDAQSFDAAKLAASFEEQRQCGGICCPDGDEETAADAVRRIPPNQDHKFNDAVFAVLFYAQIGFFIWSTVVYAPQFLSEIASSATEWTSSAQQLAYYNGVRRFLSKSEQTLPSTTTRLLEQEGEVGNGNYDGYAYNNNGEAVDNDTNLEFTVDINQVLLLLCLSTALSLVVSSLALGFMIAFSNELVQTSLFFNVAILATASLMSMFIGAVPMGITFFVMAGLMAYYTFRVWERIPFAAANLTCAVTAVRANLGLALYSYLAVLTVFLWSLWWSVATISTLYVLNGCDPDGNCQSDINGWYVFLFLLAYYWTTQVISNVVHCSTAGTVGTWWYSPALATGCCSSAVRDSYYRSITYSFGSICFASLVVAIVQAIREAIQAMRDNGDSLIACCAECILACMESIVELFNRFALVYVAVHGQSFLAAGRSVMDLFRARGWTTIITDYMVDTVLAMMSIGVGLLVGLIAVVIASAMQASGQTVLAAFVVSFIVGFAICATLLSVVSSAVNTVIVCYAEAPKEFEANHPELSKRMRSSWRQAWPNEFSY